MESNEQSELQTNRNRLRDTENRLTVVRGKGGWGLGEKDEGIKQRKKLTDLCMVIARGKEGVGGSDGSRLDLEW